MKWKIEMRASKTISIAVILLAEEFLEYEFFYKRTGITAKEVLRAYSCKVESRGNEFDDGFNPVEYDLIQERMGKSEIRRNGEVILWTVVAGSFDDWLQNTFSDVAKEE